MVEIPISKSIYNRLLIINQLSGNKIKIIGDGGADDIKVLKAALDNQSDNIVNVGHSGSALRFLTAFFSIQKREIILTGSEQLKSRPIKILVETLQQLGAVIEYIEKIGFAPIKIKGTEITGGDVSILGNVSSQYISALLMIAPYCKNGIYIKIEGGFVSTPYIIMTIKLMQQCGVDIKYNLENIISVKPGNYKKTEIKIESDWSAASYWYEMVSFTESSKIKIKNLFIDSLQGDSELVAIYKFFGVETLFHSDGIEISKIKNNQEDFLELDLKNTPDLAQTIACTCAGLKIKCKLKGLSTLPIKETNRLLALQKELLKFGAVAEITSDQLEIKKFISPLSTIKVKTYNDHRMAMAFAPLSIKFGAIEIENPKVVSKSYPLFWKHLDDIVK